MNLGTWFVYSPSSKRTGNGAFQPYKKSRLSRITDGLSNTLCASEVKMYTPYLRNAGLASPAIPTDPTAIASLGGDFKTNSGHTEWVDGRTHQSGFTTVFTPNTVVPHVVNGQTVDIDWTNQQEGKSKTNPTYAAVTSRSHHPGIVNSLRVGGSVTSVSETIHLNAWQAMSTCNGGEVIRL